MTAAVIVLNWLDLTCTLWALRRGCTELNPLLRSIVTMVWYKIAIVPLFALWLNSQGTQEARRGLRICAGVYGVVCLWHAVGIYMIMS